MTRTLLRFVVAAAALVAAAIGLEALLRTARPAVAYQYAPQQMTVTHFAASDYLPFELKRNFHGRFRMLEFDSTVSTNSLGLRDREIDFSKPRILCLGDSFTFGFGVENDDTFCARLEREFGGRYDVVNAGFAGGSSPDAYALWLTTHYDTIQPRLIVCSVFQNDFADVQSHRWEPDDGTIPRRITTPGIIVTSDGALLRDNRVARLPPRLRSLIKESYIVAMVRDRLLKDADEPTSRDAEPAAATAPAAAPTVAATVISESDRRFTRSLMLLQEAARSTPVAVHLIPAKAQRTDSHMDGLVKQFAGTAGWPVVQDYGAFGPHDYFAQDGHWVPSGHLTAAKYLHAALMRLGL